jgi:hypothetical protein
VGFACEWDFKLEWVAAFEGIKQALVSAPCLAVPRWDEEHSVATDGSCAAIGAVLSHIDPVTGLEYPTVFASIVLAAAERNHAGTEGGVWL